MKYFVIYLHIIFMLQSTQIAAQKKLKLPIQWQVATELPPLENQIKSLGFAGPIAGVIKDKLVIAGGANFPDAMPWLGGKKKYYNEVYVYSRKQNQLIQENVQFKLSANIAYAASCVTPMGIVYAGGENENGITNQVHLLQWDNTSTKLMQKSLPSLPTAITNASMVAIGSDIYFVGGETGNSTSDHFFHLNLTALEHGWDSMPSIPKPLSHVVLIVQQAGVKQNIFLFGGRAKNKTGISDFSDQSFKFDIESKKWERIKPMPYAMSAGSGITYEDKYVLLFGGDKGTRFNEVEKIISIIEAEKDVLKKQLDIEKKIELLSTHPGFSKEILRYNIIKNAWESIGVIPFEASVTTTAIQWGNWVIIPSGEIKAGVRTPKITAAKINE